MKVLFIGGTGIISLASTKLAITSGIDLWLLNRGSHSSEIKGANSIIADLSDPSSVERATQGHQWDAVVQWIAYEPDQIERDIALFRGKTKQYVFVSSASAYGPPSSGYITNESTPLLNPYWAYSRAKIDCEATLLAAHRQQGFPCVIVRPSLTYGDTQVPLVINSWDRSWTVVERMKMGLPVIVPGDGTSLWTITHNSDFATGMIGLLGQEGATGEAFHITSDEALSWKEIYRLTAEAAGVTDPELIHIPSDFIAKCLPDETGNLHGDKAVSRIFDTTKLKSFVQNFRTETRYAEGIKRTIAWFDADDRRKLIDDSAMRDWDNVIAAYQAGLNAIPHYFK